MALFLEWSILWFFPNLQLFNLKKPLHIPNIQTYIYVYIYIVYIYICTCTYIYIYVCMYVMVQLYKVGSECQVNTWSEESVGQSVSTEFSTRGIKSHSGQLSIASSKNPSDRQIDRYQIDRQIDRQIGQIDRQIDRQVDRQTVRHTFRQTYRYIDIEG